MKIKITVLDDDGMIETMISANDFVLAQKELLGLYANYMEGLINEAKRITQHQD